MGCFSFMCKECDTSIRSDSFSGELVKLFLLKDGKVIQEMEGEYDSYGCVFIDGTEDPTKNDFRKSAQWNCPEISEVDDYWKEREKHGDFHGRWLNVCGLMSKGEGTRNPNYGLPRISKSAYESFKKVFTEEGLDKELEELEADWSDIDNREWLIPPEPGNGIAAVHVKCFKEVSTTLSKHDPDQGWGRMRKKHMKKDK